MRLEVSEYDELTLAIALELGYDQARRTLLANGHWLTREQYLTDFGAYWLRPASILVLVKLGHAVGFPTVAPQALPHNGHKFP